ncbi:MAG: LytTR family DNA-binding domain-containing protein [Tissierellaceae bacterium]
MLRVAICDDEKKICSQLKDVLEKISMKFSQEIDLAIFYSGEKLCECLSKDIYFDIIFLDIELEMMNGVEVGRKIREEMLDEITQIVYISGKESYAMELFKVRPLDFIIKPLKFEKIEEVFKIALRLIKGSQGVFKYKFGYTTYSVLIKDILYFESRDRQVKIHTVNGINRFYGTLKDTHDKVREFNFIDIHKSYLVNYNHVIKFEYHQVTMSNKSVLPISQSNRKKVRALQLEIERDRL